MQKHYYPAQAVCSLILMVFLLAACTHKNASNTTPIATPVFKTKQVRQLKAFNQVDIQGQINVDLHTGYKQPQISLSGDARDLAEIKTLVSQNTLHLVVGKGYPHYGPVYADVRGQFLNRINYQGAGLLTGNQLHTSLLDVSLANKGTTKLGGSIGLRVLDVSGEGLTQISGISSQNLQIHLKGKPKVQLVGVAHLTQLTALGNAWVSLYWVKADSMILRMKKAATVQLAGTVNRMDVELWDNAHFKGRYLRAQRSFVKTHDHSIAEISAVNHQSNLATGASDIYYYNIPNTRADFMAFDGSVLDMREWSQFDREDFNRYNKQFP